MSIKKENTENIGDEFVNAMESERNSNAHGSMADKICKLEVEIDLNNNLVNETENLEGVLLNEELHDKKHVNEVHLKIKPYSCKFCEHSCSRKADMEKHVNLVHLKIRPFSCQYCDKSFLYKKTFRKHMNAKHASNLAKAFNCSYCDKSFTSKGNMNRHNKKKH